MITRGRVVKGAIASPTTGHGRAPHAEGAASAAESAPSRGKLVPAAIVDAHAAAAVLRAAAERDAKAVRAAANDEVQALKQNAAAVAEAEETAKFAARYLALRAQEEGAATRDLERSMALAVVLAERLLGAALAIDPSRITHLAQQALAEARGARVTAIHAHPLDAEALQTNLEATGLAPAVALVADEALARGSLQIDTTLGLLDAKLAPQLERLARALREHLRG